MIKEIGQNLFEIDFINLVSSFYVEAYKGGELLETWKPTSPNGSPYRRGVRVISHESYDMMIFVTYKDVLICSL